jgi:hypothetical protein
MSKRKAYGLGRKGRRRRREGECKIRKMLMGRDDMII